MTDNELIAEFMGHSTYAFADSKTYFQDPVKREMFGDPMLERLSIKLDLKYHDSWDWLMPVVEKIETPDLIKGYNFSVEILRRLEDNQVTIYSIVRDASFSMVNLWGRDVSKIKAVYKAVVEFIKWYNSNHPQP